MALHEFTMYVDDVDIADYNMKLQKYEVQSYATRKTTGIDIPGAHGTQAVPSALASSGFTVWLICADTDVDSVTTKIREFFAFIYSVSSSRRIVFSDDETIIRWAILEAPEKHRVVNGQDGAFAELRLSFLMLDPFMYDCETSKIVNDTNHGTQLIVDNEAFECPAKFRIENTGLSTVTDISLTVNDEVVNFSCSLNPGDILILDTEEYEVTLNGEPRLEYWSGEMPKLKNGNNVIVQQNAQQSKLLLFIEFTKQWV